MSRDYRMELIRLVEEQLPAFLEQHQVHMVSDVLTKALSDFEITERCTDLAPLDDANTRILKRFKACLAIDGKSEKTIYQYERTCRKLEQTVGKPFTDIGVYDIRYFLACEKARGISNVSLENARANLSAFFQWMADDEIIPKNPCRSINPIKVHKEIKKPFSDVEIDALRSACRNKKERALIEVLLSTGIRVSELSGMDIGDIDFTALSVHVRHGKGDKERMTYITSVAARRLIDYLGDRKEKDMPALFYNKNHGRMCAGGIRSVLNTLAKRAGVENVQPHRFRRTFATGLAARGMEIQEIQKLLGHSDINTTLQYVCVNDDNVKASYKKYIA